MTSRQKKVWAISVWVVLHAILLSIGLWTPWKVDSNLYSVLPDAAEFKNVSEAENALSARSARNLTVLLGHESFDEAKAAAESLDSAFASDSALAETRLKVDESTMQQMRDFFFEYRYVLQGHDVHTLLKNDDAAAIRELALQKVYGAFSLADLTRLQEDPFLLGAESFDYFTFHSPMMAGRFSLRDGVLAAEDSSVVYVMWSAALAEGTSSMASDGHVLQRLDRVLDSLQGVHKGLRVEKSGVPFHSYESSNNAQSEVAWISGVSVVAILLLLLWVFRSPLPIVCTLASIGVAVCAALSGTWAIFGSIHVFTFVFGTSVIGVSIDYAIHFFTERHNIFKGLLLGFMTTELSYVALTFAQFPLLRQMAVFSIIGLASSFATIMLLFPNLPLSVRQDSLPTRLPGKFLAVYESFDRLVARRFAKVALLVVAIVALVPGILQLDIHTDMRSLYAMSDSLKRSESLNARLNNLGISANYLIVEGESVEELLQNEERLAQRLEGAKADSLVSGYLATSTYIPSVATQRETFGGVQKLFQSSAYTELLADLKLDSASAASSDRLAGGDMGSAPTYLTPDSKLPGSFNSIIDMLWIGKVGDRFYSAVFPLHVASGFDVQKVAEGMPGVFAVSKMENVNATLTALSRLALLLVGAAYLVVVIVLALVYGFRQAIKVIRAPVIACLFIAAAFGYFGISFNFFAIVGVILTLGIGIDYTLFFKEGGSRNLKTTLAVMLSAATTLFSFGTLSLSSFVPVSTFGLSVLLGILCCFLLSPLSRR
jgi:predicted exporter